ncbi:Serine/threonine protein phosphatase 5 [Giardia duodenalis assemblage B]|uniref:Serine/threonine-protein phosphatase n=3 Tax=Giardia intestinalis TaxID=5741 RepID=A0A132NYU7_GIAIN|nr:Serine/threonine protein phosphatase [Giardia intestinalis]KWX15244.1 Serine/threonine protein phosphatase 5 [Giardia intestinalis assemblage B]
MHFGMGRKGRSHKDSGKTRRTGTVDLSSMTSFTGYTNPPLPRADLERRKKLFFSSPRQQISPLTEKEIRGFEYKITEDWFTGIVRDVRNTFVTKKVGGSVQETVNLKEILPVSFVKEVLTLGTRVLASCPNVLELTVPPTEIKAFRKKLPTEYSKNILKKCTNLSEIQGLSPGILEDLGPIDMESTNVVLPCKKLVVVGDTHGTFEVIEKVLTAEGFPADDKTVYLFNGDYVDRGSFSLEIFIVLLAIKIARPNAVHLLRGNHETESVNSNYSLPAEIEKKYGKSLSEDECNALLTMMNKAFQALPLCAVINDRYLVVHGGISAWPDFTLQDIAKLNRFREPEQAEFTDYTYFDPLSDILWADPSTEDPEFSFNYLRGTSVVFGAVAAQRFLRASELKYIIRSHSCVDEGWQVEYPGVFTLFSVPNYAEKNLGAYAVFYGLYDKNEELLQFDKEVLKDDATPKAKYNLSPSEPLVFIKKFTCSQHSAMINQPLLSDGLSPFFETQEEDSIDIPTMIRSNEEMKMSLLAQIIGAPEQCLVAAPEKGGVVVPYLIGATIGTRIHRDKDSDIHLKQRIIETAEKIPVPDSIPTDDIIEALVLLTDIMTLTTPAVIGAFPHELHAKLLHIPLDNDSYSLEELGLTIPGYAFPPTLPVEIIEIVLSCLTDPAKRDSNWLEETGAKRAMQIFRRFHDFDVPISREDRFLLQLTRTARSPPFMPPSSRPFRYAKLKY